MARKAKQPKIKRRLRQRLVLFRWALDIMGVTLDEKDPIKRLRDKLGGDGLRGIVDGHTRYNRQIQLNLFNETHMTRDQLDAYDTNIVEITRRLYPKEKHREEFEWTWFQYVCLLLVEFYLDRYFRDREGLRATLNDFLKRFNEKFDDAVPPFTFRELNKLAFQNATGSGKTHLMHANILQYEHYARRAGVWGDHKNTILITPNEGLSSQHVEKFPDHVFAADLFRKDHLPVFAAGKLRVRVLDYHDFAPEDKDGRLKVGPETVDHAQFERCNLVLVDEGHRGAKGKETGQWKSRRDELAEDGFSFEYSATFSQAIDSSDNNELKNEYAKSVLFDFSYGEFYKDGYGKEYRILNVEERPDSKRKGRTRKIDDHDEFPYLVGALLSFYQQVRYYDETGAKLAPFNIERPLMVMVGASVTKADLTKGELSDVQELLKFFRQVLERREEVTAVIQTILDDEVVLLDQGTGRCVFAGAFDWLTGLGDGADELYRDLKRRVFGSMENTLKVTHVTSNGEIRLSVGQALKPFGIINVGQSGAREVVKRCEEDLKLIVERDQTGDELMFARIDRLDHIHVLIGSRKFTEGWDSWRVSTMGLLNIGKNEGAQVIQLFGRGVRLKGQRVLDADGNEKGYSLKRSSAAPGGEGKAPEHIRVVETLNVFGVHANYMATFRDILRREGLDVSRTQTWEIPVVEVFRDKGLYAKLKIPVVPGGERGFRQSEKIPLLAEFNRLNGKIPPIVVDWFPRVESAVSRGARGTETEAEKQGSKLPPGALAFLDWDRLYFDVQRMKYEIGYNIRVTKDEVREVFKDNGWYELKLPANDRDFQFARLPMWQEIVSQLLQKLLRRLYDQRKAEFDTKHRKYVTLEEATKVGGEYEGVFPTWLITMTAEGSKDFDVETVKVLSELANAARDGKLGDFKFPKALKEVIFEQHLYRPLLVGKGNAQIVVSPVTLNENEKKLVEDVKHEYESGELKGREVYLLRNQSRGRGIGFVEGGNFYPDFILWIVLDDSQHIVFLDPHGMHHEGLSSPKVAFHKKVREIEADLKKRTSEPISLHSYLLSTTEKRLDEPHDMKGIDDDALLELGVARMYGHGYLGRVLKHAIEAAQAVSG